MVLELRKHVRFFEMCLASFPALVEGEDANKLALVYFCLQGLRVLKSFSISDLDRQGYTKYLYSYMITMLDLQGFRPSRTFRIDPNVRREMIKLYDMPNISATFFALASLLALELDYSQHIDRTKTLKFVARCQIASGPDKGAFRPSMDANGEPFGEAEMRTSYMAICIGKLCNLYEGIDLDAVVEYVTSRVCYSGGLCSSPYSEAHAGFTFCGLALLKLIDYNFSSDWTHKTIHWLVSRQVDYSAPVYVDLPSYPSWNVEDKGGFNGRDNKFADTCYSWWCTASLGLIDQNYPELCDIPAARAYLLNRTQNRLVGGFGKDHQLRPDPMHTFLALSSLAMWNKGLNETEDSQLDLVDVSLAISAQSADFLQRLWG